jgi:hypothetical protein
MATTRLPKQFHKAHAPGVVPGRTPHSLGRYDAGDPTLSTALRGDTPGSVGTGQDAGDPAETNGGGLSGPIFVMLLNPKPTLRFLRSVALACANQERVKLRWTEDKDGFMQGLYSILFWKGRPGWAEVDPGDAREIQQIADQHMKLYVEGWVKHCCEGPKAVKDYLEGLEKIREYCLNSVGDVYREAAELNVEVRREAARGIEILAAYKLSADIFVKTASLFAPGASQFAASLVDTGYDFSLILIKSLDEAPRASVVAIAEKTGEILTDKAGEKAAEKGDEKLIEGANFASHVKDLEGLIERNKKWVARGSRKSKKLLARIGEKELEKEAAEKSARYAFRASRGLKLFGPTMKIMFYVHDVAESLSEYNETVKRAEEGIE